MEKVTEKEIVNKLNKDFEEALYSSDYELHINWYVELIFALKRKIYYHHYRRK